MNYEKLSDFEINILVAKSRGLLVKEEIEDREIGFNKRFHQQYPNTVWAAPCNFLREQTDCWEQFCFTRTPQDAWPIIQDNMISIEWHGHGSRKRVYGYCNSGLVECMAEDQKEVLRAAMIVYLKQIDGGLPEQQ